MSVCLFILRHDFSPNWSSQVSAVEVINRNWNWFHQIFYIANKFSKLYLNKEIEFSLNRAHEKRHNGDTKKEKCQLCSAAYEHKFHFLQHLKRKHGIEKKVNTWQVLKLDHSNTPSGVEKNFPWEKNANHFDNAWTFYIFFLFIRILQLNGYRIHKVW